LIESLPNLIVEESETRRLPLRYLLEKRAGAYGPRVDGGNPRGGVDRIARRYHRAYPLPVHSRMMGLAGASHACR